MHMVIPYGLIICLICFFFHNASDTLLFSGGIRQYISMVTNLEAFIGNVCEVCRDFPS
jgi:hypothetical protein